MIDDEQIQDVATGIHNALKGLTYMEAIGILETTKYALLRK